MMSNLIERAMTLVARSGGTVEAGAKAPGQGGVIEGQNPTTYDPKNPVCKIIEWSCA